MREHEGFMERYAKLLLLHCTQNTTRSEQLRSLLLRMAIMVRGTSFPLMRWYFLDILDLILFCSLHERDNNARPGLSDIGPPLRIFIIN